MDSGDAHEALELPILGNLGQPVDDEASGSKIKNFSLTTECKSKI